MSSFDESKQITATIESGSVFKQCSQFSTPGINILTNAAETLTQALISSPASNQATLEPLLKIEISSEAAQDTTEPIFDVKKNDTVSLATCLVGGDNEEKKLHSEKSSFACGEAKSEETCEIVRSSSSCLSPDNTNKPKKRTTEHFQEAELISPWKRLKLLPSQKFSEKLESVKMSSATINGRDKMTFKTREVTECKEIVTRKNWHIIVDRYLSSEDILEEDIHRITTDGGSSTRKRNRLESSKVRSNAHKKRRSNQSDVESVQSVTVARHSGQSTIDPNKIEPLVQKSNKLSSASSSNNNVFGKWEEDSCYYPAKIKKKISESSYELLFHDGFKYNVSDDHILRLDQIKPQQEVMVRIRKNIYEEAVIKSIDDDHHFNVELENGSIHKCIKWSDLMFTARHAEAITKEVETVSIENTERVRGLFTDTLFAITMPSRDGTTATSACMKTSMNTDFFDKRYIREIIIQNQGTVIDNVSPNEFLKQVLKAKERHTERSISAEERKNRCFREQFSQPVILISHTESRTVKYLLSLALNIPCISYEWVIKCVKAQKRITWRNYLLPRGQLLETGATIKASFLKKVDGIFKNKSALVWSDNEEFQDAVSAILKAGQCPTIFIEFSKHDSTELFPDTVPEIIIGDTTENATDLSKKLIKRYNDNTLPILTMEWLIQTIISGEIRNATANVAYTFNTTTSEQ